MKSKKIDKKYFIILAVSLFIFAPYISKVLARGDDYRYHLANIEAIATSIKNGICFYPRVLPNIAHNLGYASPLFYPPLAHQIGAIIYLILNHVGISLNVSFKIILFLAYLLASIFFYQSAKKIIKNENGPLISTIIYMCLPYFLTDIFHRAALAEIFVFMFTPLIIRSMYHLLHKEYKSFSIYFIIGFSGMILSHLVITVYFAILIFIFLLVNIKNIWNKKTIQALCLSSLAVIGITSLFTFPMIEQKLSANYVVFAKDSMASAGSVYNRALNLGDYLYETGNQDITTYFSTISLILVIFVLIERKTILKEENKENQNFWKGIIIFTGISILLSSKLIPWKILPTFLYNIQFPWRLNAFTGLGIAFLVGLSPMLFKDKKIEKILIILVITLSLLDAHNVVYKEGFTNKSLNISSLKEFNEAMGYQKEYLTVNGIENVDYLKNRNQDILVTEGKASINILNNTTPNLEFTITTTDATLELPRLYYKGYEIILKDDNNHKTKLEYKENEVGLIEIKVNQSGTINIKYKGTTLQHICTVLSLISLIATIIIIAKMKN